MKKILDKTLLKLYDVFDGAFSFQYEQSFNKIVVSRQSSASLAVFMMTSSKNSIALNYILNLYRPYCSGVDIFFYSDHESVVQRCIMVSKNNMYISNELKNLRVLNLLVKNVNLLNYSYYLFCDDDTVLNIPKIQAFLSREPFDEYDVYGSVIDCTLDTQNEMCKRFNGLKYLSGGAGYMFSKRLLANKIDSFINYYTKFADVSIGLNFMRCGVNVQNLLGLNKTKNSAFESFSNLDISDQLSYHHVKDEKLFTKYFEAMLEQSN